MVQENLSLGISSEYEHSTVNMVIFLIGKNFHRGLLIILCNSNSNMNIQADSCWCKCFLSYNHWFDGMALMHRFQIEDGQVTYRSRFLRSDSYKQNSEKNRIMVSEFGTLALPDPCKNFFQRFLSRFEMISTSNMCVNDSKEVYLLCCLPWRNGSQ